MTPTQVAALSTAQTTATNAQTDATQAKTWSDPATSKTMGNAGTTQTFAGLVANFLRAVASTLILRSSLGAGSTDVCVSAGPETPDGSTHSSAKLFRVATGNGTGSEQEYFYVQKNGFYRFGSGNALLFAATTNYTLSLGASGASLLGPPGGATEVSAKSYYTQMVGSGCVFRVGAGDSSNIPRIEISGVDKSGTPGNATINAPTGKVAIDIGSSQVVITNSVVSAGDGVLITPHARDATCKELIAVCTSGAITISGIAAATAVLPVSFVVHKRA